MNCEQTLPKGLLSKKTAFETPKDLKRRCLVTAYFAYIYNLFCNKSCIEAPPFSICCKLVGSDDCSPELAITRRCPGQ